ncbi:MULTISPECIES: LacI family DNA-binding transcriptional regulator [Streptosporangium]|uniref:DNA-binding LacI/PurR family transcriptional regulator n=1 Tax=Streptosporangium brasiliense TaxID=47480 RepID=A0ABT9R0B5_9ACTN|nr:LacI family DNA-binding transcriptional regulator [Streptosporangium brasiliense]MDP9862661.1 DNA-binding LacI/PurR family transcriptional regulator [Streptosporangium brasiliense]
MTPRIGIRDVARATGLSITTVSHALSGKGRVSERTRDVVRAAAERLGYQPDPIAAGLASGRVGVIGILVEHVSSRHWEHTYRPYYAAFISGATMLAVERDHAVVVLPTALWGKVPLDGVIIVDPAHGDPIVTECRRRGKPVVTDGKPLDPDCADVPGIESDSDETLHVLLGGLRDAGASRIALLTGTEPDSYTLDTERAYRSWAAANGNPVIIEALQPGESPAVAAERLLSRPDRPDAVHGLNETYGEALLGAARRLGLSIPGDLLVTIMCETAEDKHWEVPLSVLSLEAERRGAVAAAALVDLLSGEEPGRLRVPTRLVIRESTSRSGAGDTGGGT